MIMGTLIALVACSNSPRNSTSNVIGPSSNLDTSSIDGSFEISVEGVKELRNPEGLSHRPSSYEFYYTEDFRSFASKMRDFSAKLSEAIAKREYKSGKNYVVSPLSIELCLGLAIRSSSGETRKELLDVLDIDYDTFNRNYKLYFNYLYEDVKNNMGNTVAQLLLTNSIWIDDEASLKDDCLDALRDDYYCYSYEADFNGKNKETNQAIREFVKQATKGLIDQDLRIPADTILTLMNTIYLKSIWNETGSDLGYAPESYQFKNSNGSISLKQLLIGNLNEGRAIYNEDYSSFHTSGKGGIRIYFIKANEGKNIKDVFNKDTINHILNNQNYVYKDDEKLERYYTQCYFPEYEAYTDLDLVKVFKEDFNVTSLFNRSACDFSNLSNYRLYCSDFRQIAKLKVDKTGIEGAAVTYMTYAGDAGPDGYTEVYEKFIVDQEFGYVITSDSSIIFSGIITNIDK